MDEKILFVYNHPDSKNWMDGLSVAIDELKAERLNLVENPPSSFDDMNAKFMEYDMVLGWGAFNSPVDKLLRITEANKKGLFIAGTPPEIEPEKYDVVFYETDWQGQQLTHKNKHKAFGVNTNIYNKIDIATPIVWDYIGVGSFSNWKRWEKMCEKKGNKLVVGEYQRGNEIESLGIVRNLVANGVMVSPMVTAFDLANFYHWSRTLYIPATTEGGGERAILEARSCGLTVEVEDDNPKLKELISGDIPTEKDYYNAIIKGLETIL